MKKYKMSINIQQQLVKFKLTGDEVTGRIIEWETGGADRNSVYSVELLKLMNDKNRHAQLQDMIASRSYREGSITYYCCDHSFGYDQIKTAKRTELIVPYLNVTRTLDAIIRRRDSATTATASHITVEFAMAIAYYHLGNIMSWNPSLIDDLARKSDVVNIPITLAAEYVIQMLEAVVKYGDLFGSVEIQELVDYARRVLADINAMQKFEEVTYANTLKMLRNHASYEKFEKQAAKYGMTIQSLFGIDIADVSVAMAWRDAALRANAAKICGTSMCKKCRANKSQVWIITSILLNGILSEKYSAFVKTVPSTHAKVLKDAVAKLELEFSSNGFLTTASYDKLKLSSEYIAWAERQNLSDIYESNQVAHVLELHADDIYVPEVITFDVETDADKEFAKLLLHATTQAIPIVEATMYLPFDEKIDQLLYERYYQTRSYYESLELSEYRLLVALDEMFQATRFDGMAAFAANTRILSQNTAFDRIATARPVHPHNFQREYLNGILEAVNQRRKESVYNQDRTDINAKTGTGRDPNLVIEPSDVASMFGVKIGEVAYEELMEKYAVETIRQYADHANYGNKRVFMAFINYIRTHIDMYAEATFEPSRGHFASLASIVLRKLRSSQDRQKYLEKLTTQELELVTCFGRGSCVVDVTNATRIVIANDERMLAEESLNEARTILETDIEMRADDLNTLMTMAYNESPTQAYNVLSIHDSKIRTPCLKPLHIVVHGSEHYTLLAVDEYGNATIHDSVYDSFPADVIDLVRGLIGMDATLRFNMLHAQGINECGFCVLNCARQLLKCTYITNPAPGQLRAHYGAVLLNLRQTELEALAVTDGMNALDAAYAMHGGDTGESSVTSDSFVGTPSGSPLSASQSAAIASPIGNAQAASPVLTDSEAMYKLDIAIIKHVISKYSSGSVSIAKNAGSITLQCLRGVAGAGKTTVALLAAALIRRIKEKDLAFPGTELVFCSDQYMVRSETFDKITTLANINIKATLIERSATGGEYTCTSNFKIHGVTTKLGGRQVRNDVDPGFKCPDRDIFIMSSEVLIPYIMGRRDAGEDAGWYGNPHAFVFIDEFCARAGDASAVAALEGVDVIKAFSSQIPAILLLSNSPSLLSVAGATLVPTVMIHDTIHRFQPQRNVTEVESIDGKIYVGSQLFTPSDKQINLWELCTPNLLNDMFTGFREALLKRTVGARSAVALRKRILDVIASGEYPRLKEMENYARYDIGVYTGDSVANYTLGLLYFIYLYAEKYVGPAPGLVATCADFAHVTPFSLPPEAPWPKSHFVNADAPYLSYAHPLPSNFLGKFGIQLEWRHTAPISKTMFEKCYEEWQAGAAERKRSPRLILDSNPLEFAMNLMAKILGISVNDVEAYALREYTSARAAIDAHNEKVARAKARNVAVVGSRAAGMALVNQGLHAVEAGDGGGGRRTGGTVRANVATQASVQHAQDLMNENSPAGIVTVTGNPRYLGSTDIVDQWNSVDYIDQLFLSYGIVRLDRTQSEKSVRQLFGYAVGSHKKRTFIYVMDSIGAYGINIPNAVKAFVTPRGAMNFSIETIKQFYSRCGRSGMSDDSNSYADLCTFVRICEDSLFENDRALYPNIHITIKEMSNSPSYDALLAAIDAKAHTAGPDGQQVLRQELTRELVPRLLAHGQTNAECELVPFIIGALQVHIVEPFGYVDNATKLKRSWPHLGNADATGETRLIIEALSNMAYMYSRARDRTSFSLYADFMHVDAKNNGQFYATEIIAKIANEVTRHAAIQ